MFQPVIPDNIDIVLIRRGVSRAALVQNSQIETLTAELHDAYKNEVEAGSAVADARRLNEELQAARIKLRECQKELENTERKLAALSGSRLGGLQLRYWRLRKKGRGNS